MAKADLNKKPAEVAAMFDDVAAKYDRTNALLSFGQDAGWRRAVTRALDIAPGQVVLDLAAGTGTSSEALRKQGADVVAGDFSEGMLAEGRRRHPDVEFVYADAMDLPFGDASFDAVTISFGLRNVADPQRALAEMHRVTKPGGRIVVCEFSHPHLIGFAQSYGFYLQSVLPRVARAVSSDPSAYEYLSDTIRDWPGPSELAHMMQDAGWDAVEYRELTLGIVALHRAFRLAR